MQLGASFSHRHLKYLDLEPTQAIKEFSSLGLSWIRLGCYWDETELSPVKFTFQNLDPLIAFCEKEGINVVLTVGMKAPRWPEYYLPKWILQQLSLKRLTKIDAKNDKLLNLTLNYVQKAVTHFKKSSAIKVWQVENEPLDPSGGKWWRISSDFLAEEIKLIRKLDPKRKILVNLWGNELSRRQLYKPAAELADIVGLDLYLRNPIPLMRWFNKYIGPLDSKEKIQQIVKQIQKDGREFWITELQAEPWEPGEIITKKKNPPSFLPKHFKENLNYAKTLGPKVTLLWGFEYWLWRKEKGDLQYWEEAKRIIKK